MDQGPPDTKRPRLSTGPAWLGGSHHGVSLLHPTPSPTPGQLPHHPPPSTQYQQRSPLSFARPLGGPGDPHPPPPPPPPHPAAQPPPIDDRRQHEPDRFPPMQEHRQPPHSPAHPPFPPYPPREPMIKADPADDALPQLRRPLSTGGSVHQDTMTPVTPHSAVPPPPPHSQPYGEDRRHLSFDNGHQPPMYNRQPSYQPQTPLPHPQPYDYPPQYASHGELPYPISVTAASGKRKAQRASQACDMCRQLKAKCDELKPCKSCKEKKVECKYREAIPKQQDRITADILDTLLAFQKTFEQRMTRLERAVGNRAVGNGALLDLADDPLHDDDDRPESAESVPRTAEDGDSVSPADTATTQAPINSLDARTIARDMEEEKEVVPGPIVRPGKTSIPLNHTTLAAFLLKWRPIKALVRGILEAENVKYIDEFPIRQEERRGLLRVWGRGEGLDSFGGDKADKESIRDSGAMEAIQDDISDAGAPSPADCWGGINGSPAPIDGKAIIGVQAPDFSEALVWKYVKSFQDNIQNMHPLIIPRELNAMVKLFLDTVQQTGNRSSQGAGIAKFVATTPSAQPETGTKRKRSPGPDGAEQPPVSPKSTKPVFQRSINNAVVLLVLALGKVCLHKDRIPDVVPVSEPQQGSPLARNGYPASPIQGSSPSYASHSHSAGLPSPKEGGERGGPSRRASFQGSGSSIKGGRSLKRNLDVIPGLDYFAYATDILGGQLAGTSLRHIYAYLLAGLYHGQLGRVLESYAYIKEAGFAIQVKMRPRLDRFRKLQEAMQLDQHAVTEKSDNLIVFAFWTCLQLESDIIAELPLPQSHILAYEDIMPYPNINLAEEAGFDGHVLRSYLAQLYLRKSLNSIHGMLYNPEKPQPLLPTAGAPGGNIIDYIQRSLDMRFVPPEFKFGHNDPPAGDILSARLRAKYWGAQVITYRPFVRQILELNFQKTVGPDSPMPPSDFRSDVSVPVIGPDNGIPPEMIEYAVKGVRALIESTRAFHGLKEKRFIITNVFGTSHAQWGNLVTLSAVFRDPTLHGFIQEDVLKELFVRTISFFRVIAYPTSALSIDLRILEHLERELWGRPINSDLMDGIIRSSFSSTSGGPPPVPLMGPVPPPVAAPSGLHSPGSHAPGGMMTMSPPLASPLPASAPPAAPSEPTPISPQAYGTHMSMLPPMHHQHPL